MGRELQKKKRRSKRQPVRPKKPGKVLNPRGNTIIAKQWNKNETLAQNYRRLGLVSRLRGATGGMEKKLATNKDAKNTTTTGDTLLIKPATQAVVTEARVERGPDGKIVCVLDGKRDNPLNDALCSSDDEEASEEDAPTTDTVRQLLEMSRSSALRRVTVPSAREREWLRRLVEKHGDDTQAMARDMRLNPMQQTAADIARRIKRLNETS